MKTRYLFIIATLLCICFSAPAYVQAEEGAFSIGIMGGAVGAASSEAVDGFPDTEWKTDGVVGLSLKYRFPTVTTGAATIELLFESFDMKLEENGLNIGTLNVKPVMLLFGIQGIPYQGIGWTGHAEIGGGIATATFEKGPAITDLESGFNVKYNIATDSAFVFELGGGADYFFSRNVSLNLDLKLLLSSMDTNWSVSGFGQSASLSDINKFNISNVQGLVGLRVWF